MDKIEVLDKLDKYSGMESGTGRNVFGLNGDCLSYANLPVSSDALSMAAKWASIPNSFFFRLPVDLQVELLNRLFDEYSGYPKVLYTNSEILAFVHPLASILDSAKIVNTLDSSLSNMEIDRLYESGGSVEIYAHGPKEHSVVKGDIVQGGVWLKFSPVAEINPEIAGYMYRLVCTNGLIREQEFARFGYSHGGDPYEWIGVSAYNLYNSMEDEIAKYREMRETKLNGNLSSVLNHLIEDLPISIRSVVKDYIMDRSPDNMYDLMNYIAEFASHKLDNPRHIWNAMASSGRTVRHTEFCPICHSVMN